jgi:hypothetical protein
VPTGANSTELARRYREFGGDAEIVLLSDLGASRANSKGQDGPELYESEALVKFLLRLRGNRALGCIFCRGDSPVSGRGSHAI